MAVTKTLHWLDENIKDVSITVYDGSVSFWNTYIIGLIVAPHDKEELWLLRLGVMPTFDRWANSTAVEEFFSGEEEVLDYLENNQAEIYKALFEDICDEIINY